MTLRYTILSGLLLFSTSALASQWDGSAHLGASASDGNTDQFTILAGFDISTEQGKWKHNIITDVYQSKRDNQTTADRLSLTYKPNWFYAETAYLFSLIQQEIDEPANIKVRSSLILGLGIDIHRSTASLLSGELGIGGKKTDLVNGDDFDDNVAYASLKYVNKLSENAKIDSKLRTDIGDENTSTHLNIGLSAKIVKTIAMKLSLDVRHNSDISGAKNEKMDTTSNISFVKSF